MGKNLLNRFPLTTKRWLLISARHLHDFYVDDSVTAGQFLRKNCAIRFTHRFIYLLDSQSQLNSTKFISRCWMLQDNCLFVCLIVAARMFSCDFWARFFFGVIETCFNWNKILNVVHDKCQMMRFFPAIMMITKYCVFLSSQVMRNIVCIT